MSIFDKGRILLFSDAGREDVATLWYACLQKHWPDCPVKIEVLAEGGWTARMRTYLLANPEVEWAIYWLDDNWLFRSPHRTPRGEIRVGSFEKWLSFLEGHPEVGVVRDQEIGVDSDMYAVPIPDSSIFVYAHGPRWPYFAMTGRPTLWRTTALLGTTALLDRLTPEQDSAWSGCWNWEMYGGFELVGKWEVAAVSSEVYARESELFAVRNACKQGRWDTDGLHALESCLGIQGEGLPFTCETMTGLAHRLGVETSRPIYRGPEDDWTLDLVRQQGHPRPRRGDG